MAEAPYTALRPLVESLVVELLPFIDKPFAFYGHSLGALVGFELARHLRRNHGLEPCGLFVSGYPAPQLRNDEPETYSLPDPELIEVLRRLNGIPAEVCQHAEMMKLWLPVLRADLTICQTYIYTPAERLTCPIIAFGGQQDQKVGREQLERWREQTTASFSLQILPGDHFFLHSSQATLLRRISKALLQLACRRT